MKRVFGDSFYFIALLNERDAAHIQVRQFAARHRMHVVTTRWILAEVADALCQAAWRGRVGASLAFMMARSKFTVHAQSDDLFERGLALYRSRADKDWSLTDCISFVVMADERLTDALTSDRHFEQAGFKALLA